MKKTLTQGEVFTAWSIKQVGIKLNKQFGLDLGITGNNGKNYFKHRIDGIYNVYFMKHWSSFGEIYDIQNQQITNIVPDEDHKYIHEHWRGFSHREVFNRYSTKAVKEAEYAHNFKTNDGLRLVFAAVGEMSWMFWGVYELDRIDEKTKTKVWKLVSKQFPMGKMAKAVVKVEEKVTKPLAKKAKAAGKAIKKTTKKVVNKVKQANKAVAAKIAAKKASKK